jgi:AcrR family transcriptional regulator
MAEPVKRRYHSPTRQAQAARTRAQILDAADELFRTQGFGRTSVRQIAEAAEVVPETVYANFGSKARLQTALIDSRLAPDGQTSVRDRPEFVALADEPDQRRILHAFAQDWARMSERVRPVSEILRTAKAVDPEMATIREEMEGNRYRYLRSIAELLLARGPLLVDIDRAADIIWTLASPDVGRMLCDDRGWTTEDYAKWLENTLAETLIPSRLRRRSPSASSAPEQTSRSRTARP